MENLYKRTIVAAPLSRLSITMQRCLTLERTAQCPGRTRTYAHRVR